MNAGDTESEDSRLGKWSTFSSLTAGVTILLGLVVLVGWAFNLPLLKSVLPGAVEMKANTAVGLILSACALFIYSNQPSQSQQRVAQGLAFAVLALGLATLGQYLFGWQLGIDELLFRDTADAFNVIHGRMSPFSAVVFATAGLSLTVLPLRALRKLVWLGAAVVTAIGAISFLGYLWNASELVTDQWLPPVAVNTAIAFTLIGAGLFCTIKPASQTKLLRSSIEFRVLVGFIITFGLLVLAGGYTYRTGAEYENSAQWVEHSQQVRARLAQLYGSISDIESAQRSYLLTGETLYKQQYKGFVSGVKDDQQKLARLVLDNPEQTGNLDKLNQLVTHRLRLLALQVPLFERRGLVKTTNEIARSDGIAAMQSIRNMVDHMDSVEMGLLSTRKATLKHNRQVTFVSLVATLSVTLVVLVVMFLGIRKEMIARSIAEKASKNSSARIAAILETAVDGVITINERGIVETYNPAAEQMFGYAAAEVVGQNINMLMPERYRGQHDRQIERFCGTGKPKIIGATGREVIGQREDGSTFPMEVAISEMKLEGQRYFSAIVHDITEHKQSEALLQQAKEKAELANRAKDSFLATMSHEIRTPLTGMLGMLELLSMAHLDHDQKKTLQAARDSSMSLLRIVSDILDWSKIEEGKMALSPRPTSISQLLQEVVNTYSRVASAKSLVLHQHADPRLSSTHLVDSLRLSQILNNFVSNAIKFTQHGEVELGAELLDRVESGERIRFSVRDTGIGIGEDAQKLLFQRYQQEHAETARMYGGTGLGLSICRRLVDMMDGQIELASKPGWGSVFSVTLVLPITGAPGESAYEPHPEVQKRAITPLFEGDEDAPLVLAVDDHPINRDLLARQIKLLGLRAETAENGKVALSKWRGGRFALVITDCHMPEMDGYALAEAIRGIEYEKNLHRTPIVAWTANAVGDETEHCRASGMDELLVKPANLSQLKDVLAQMLHIAKTDDGQPALSPSDAEKGQGIGPIDYAVLRQTVPDSAEHAQLLDAFQSQIRTDLEILNKMLEQGDQINLERTAHRMKGACKMVGAVYLTEACAAIEQAARNGDLAGAGAAKVSLGEAIVQLQTVLLDAKVTQG